MTRLATVAALLLLAACGRQGVLEPRPGAGVAPLPINTTTAPTTDQLLAIPPQAAPDRVDDPVRNSNERREDRFNLPPPG